MVIAKLHNTNDTCLGEAWIVHVLLCKKTHDILHEGMAVERQRANISTSPDFYVDFFQL